MDNIDNTDKQKPRTKVPKVPKEVDPPEALTGISFIDSMSLVELNSRPDIGMNPRLSDAYKKRLRALSYRDAVEKTAARLERNALIRQAKNNRRLEVRGKIFTESKEVKGEMTETLTSPDIHENVTDFGGETPSASKLGQSLRDTPDGQRTQYSLQKFFERPVPIFDDDWTLGTQQMSTLDIWDIWSKNQAVRAKLSNYAYFKGNLKVKISFSGTPFHYGVVMASYQPYAEKNTNLTKYNQFLSAALAPTSADTYAALKVYLSQAPGCDYISVTDNEPLILDIPFISYKEKFRLWNSSTTVITPTTSYDDFAEAGTLYLLTLNPIQVANEDYSSPVSFNVYAWVEDIELGCITGTEVNITAESRIVAEAKKSKGGNANVGKKAKQIENLAEDIQDTSYSARMNKMDSENHAAFQKSKSNKPMYSGQGNFGERFMDSIEAGVRGDEFEEPGPVQNIATGVTQIGDTLSTMPVIGPYAKATSSISAAIGKVASMFGWSRPIVLEKPIFVKNNPFSNGAFTEGPETSLKLSCDPKQELTVDTTIGGMWGDDEMTVLSIASRESYLTTFSWQDSDVAMTTNLWESVVTPYQHALIPMGSSQTAVQPTAMEMAAVPFRYWRGTIKYRFEIVCSKFHRGKLVFVYEPNDAQMALINSGSTQLNQQNVTILDIQEAQDITFEVDWAAPRSWGYNNYFPTTAMSVMENYPSLSGVVTSKQNGYIVVRALNELVQPTDSADVKINVYVSCDDLQVAFPDTTVLPNNRTIVTESKQVINPTGATVDKIHLMHFGEKVVSFRALMKRYQTLFTDSLSRGTTGPTHVSAFLAPMPQVFNDKSGTGSQNTIEGFLFEYLRYGYMGMRGGGRYRILPSYKGDDIANYVRTTMTPQYPLVDNFQSASIGAVSTAFDFDFYGGSRFSGTVTHHISSNGGVEFEIPFYSENLFVFSAIKNYGYQEIDEYLLYDCDPLVATCSVLMPDYTANKKFNLAIDYATAEDFTFLRFQGAGLWNATNF